MKVLICIPTLNAEHHLKSFFDEFRNQSRFIYEFIVIDSSSTDLTASICASNGAQIHILPRCSFNHGATRQLVLSLCPDADIIIYMTQDAILASSDSIKNILRPFEDKDVGAVCGRQLPHADASPIAAHARLFNYPAISSVRSKEDIPCIGIKAAFISNSFAAYRRTALIEVGGFPSNVIFGEDTYVAAKMLQAGWTVVYTSEATCYHSHNYSISEEFKRYFDIGVFHSREKWFIESLGKPEGEGKKFFISELRYLLKHAPLLIPSAILRTGFKLLGYKLGQREQALPTWVKLLLSMNKGYWESG
jgi:rhamnosyltransferase